MLNLFQSIRNLLGGKAQAPAAPQKQPGQSVKKSDRKGASPNRRNSRPDGESSPRREAGQERSGRRSRRGRSAGRSTSAAAPQSSAAAPAAAPREQKAARPEPKRKKPVRPEALREVPEVEGKKRFLDFPLPEAVQFGIQHLNFEYCTPIQAAALPDLLAGHDLGGKAQTGTGKTAAFLLAAFTRMTERPLAERKPGTPRVLVLAPTRELAVQIHKDAEALGCFTDFNNVVVFGGMDHQKQRRELEEPIDILAGTPGRIIDYSRGGDLDLSQVEILVIDEADRMLDMGFIPDVRRIVAQLPPKGVRQTLLFSATLEPEILRLAQSFLKDPVMVETEPEQVVGSTIEQTFYSVSGAEKLALLLYIIKHEPFERMLIFGNRKDKNLDVYEALQKCGIAVELMSGDIPQQKRMRILEDFRSGKVRIVIATDVAARGIHVDDVSLVINYDLPERCEDYVHRIGRTGRAGHQGKAISFICEYGAYYIPEIEKFVGEEFHSTLPAEEMVTIPEEYREVLRKRPRSRGRRRA